MVKNTIRYSNVIHRRNLKRNTIQSNIQGALIPNSKKSAEALDDFIGIIHSSSRADIG